MVGLNNGWTDAARCQRCQLRYNYVARAIQNNAESWVECRVESGVTNIDSELPQWNYSCSKLKILWRSVSMINNNKCAMNTTVDMAFNVNLAEIFMQFCLLDWRIFVSSFSGVFISPGWCHLLVLACAVIDLWQTLQLPPYQICHNLIAPANYD